MRWTVTLAILALILSPPQPAPAQEEAESAEPEQIEATDFVIGLHAFNRQVLDALEQQPTRRVMVLPFTGDKSAALGKYITEQLITAVAASRHYEIVDSGPLADIVAVAGLDPFELGNSPEFKAASPQFANIVIVLGKVTPLGTRYGVNALLLNGETGRTSGGAQVYLIAAEEIAALTGKAPAAEPAQVESETPEQEQVETTDATQQEITQPEAELGQETQQQAAETGSLEGRSEQSIYDEAYADYKAGRYNKAVMLFNQVLANNPESPLADNALYWIGESHYARKNFEEALAAFQRVLKEYPFGNKVPDAMLKAAYCQERLGRQQDAAAMLEDLIARFDKSNAAELGKRTLQLLRAAMQQ